MVEDDITKFKRIDKVGISISVNKENLERLKEFIAKKDPKVPLSLPFDAWLESFVRQLNLLEAKEKEKGANEKEKSQKDGDKNEI